MFSDAVLLAETSFNRFFRGLTEGIQGQRGEWSAAGLTLWLLIGAAGVGALAAAYYRFVRRPRDAKAATPAALFEKLCQAHGLSVAEVDLLKELVRQDHMALPPRIFLEPERFEIERRTGALAQRGGEIVTLRDKLFAETR